VFVVTLVLVLVEAEVDGAELLELVVVLVVDDAGDSGLDEVELELELLLRVAGVDVDVDVELVVQSEDATDDDDDVVVEVEVLEVVIIARRL